jgi:UDP-N-acetylglucosamine kinase
MLDRAKSRLKLDDKSPVDNPQLVILGGQPGSGKSSAIEVIEAMFNSNIVALNGDDFKTLYPDYDDLLAKDPLKTAHDVQPYSNHVVNELQKELSAKKYNMLIEGTMRTSEAPLKTLTEFKDKGYQTEAYVVSSNYYASRTGCLLRREIDMMLSGSGRDVPVTSHDAAYNNIPGTMETIIKSGKLDNLTVLTRSGNLLGSLQNGDDVVSLYSAHRNNLTTNEYNQIHSDLGRVIDLMENRNANVAEVDQIRDLRTQLAVNHGLDKEIKSELKNYLAKEIELALSKQQNIHNLVAGQADRTTQKDNIAYLP